MNSLCSALLVLAAAGALYLAAPRQQLLRRPWPAWLALGAAAAFIAAACALRAGHEAAHTQFFTVLTLLMLAWCFIPYAVQWVRHGRAR